MPLTALIEAPTIEQLALLVAGDADRDSLVLIRDGGDLPALFLVHDGDGETMLYRNLALRLNDEHAVYGLQPYVLAERADGRHPYRRDGRLPHPQDTLDPAAGTVSGGECGAGGVIAFEIALQLKRQGENAALVAVIDAADVAATRKNLRMAGQRLSRLSVCDKPEQRARFDRRIMTGGQKGPEQSK